MIELKKETGDEFGGLLKKSKIRESILFVVEAQKDESGLDEITILEHADIFHVWDENWTGKRGSIVRDDEKLYKSIHDVGAGQNTKPSETPSMWTLIGDPGEEYPMWVQPLGAFDAYRLGDRAAHKGKRWVSTADANTWEPGVYGWDEAVE